MNIWIDIVNSPHVLFFRPLINEYIEMGHNVTVTARKFGKTTSLLDSFAIPYKLVGSHKGSNFINKLTGLLSRSFSLLNYARDKNFDIALSHNSNDIAIASLFLDIPLVTSFDYEHAYSHHINVRVSKRVVIPSWIPSSSIYRYGASDIKIINYEGLKESYYLDKFKPDNSLVHKLKIDTSKVVITIRPPAESSHYHAKISNNLFYKLLLFLNRIKKVQTFVMPRTSSQASRLKSLKLSNIHLLEERVDGPSLVSHSDIVISAGGTMNREAVVLGTPVYTIFKPEMGAVDKTLIKKNFLKNLTNISSLKIVKKVSTPSFETIHPKVLANLFLINKNGK